jgi:hypothetical protein
MVKGTRSKKHARWNSSVVFTFRFAEEALVTLLWISGDPTDAENTHHVRDPKRLAWPQVSRIR